MKNPLLVLIILSSLFSSVLSACSSQPNQPEDVVEAYYQGLIDKDAAAVVSNSCAGWETQAQFEVDAFRRVNANLNDLVCESNNTDSNRALVLCTGIFTFGNGTETEEVNIEGRLHFVVNEDGQWLMCGYGE